VRSGKVIRSSTFNFYPQHVDEVIVAAPLPPSARFFPLTPVGVAVKLEDRANKGRSFVGKGMPPHSKEKTYP
jgi:hypothetical protein